MAANKIRKLFMVLMAVSILSGTSATAFAFTNENAQETAQTEVVPEQTTETELPEAEKPSQQTDAIPFSVPGNGQLVDDISEDDTKQFLTIQTKNGNTFFLVVDRSSNTENVYMLSMVDENDLAEFLDKGKEEPQVVIPTVIPETVEEAKPSEPEKEAETEKETEAKGNPNPAIVAAFLAAGGIGAGYYFKVVKPKKDEGESESEELEFDDGVYLNEQQQGASGKENDDE